MKIANRFLVILASILFGGLFGVGYFATESCRTAQSKPSERTIRATCQEFRSNFGQFNDFRKSDAKPKCKTQRIKHLAVAPRTARPFQIAPSASKKPTLYALVTQKKKQDVIRSEAGSNLIHSEVENEETKLLPTAPMTLEMANEKITEIAKNSATLSDSLQSLIQMATTEPVKNDSETKTLIAKKEKRTALIQVSDFHSTQIAENSLQTNEFPRLDGELELAISEYAIGNQAKMNLNPFRNTYVVEVPVEGMENDVEMEKEIKVETKTDVALVAETEKTATQTENIESPNAENAKTTKETKKYRLDVYRENVRKLLAIFQRETGLKVVASLDVQGEATCQMESDEPEALLRNLLAVTVFHFVRDGEVVYVARAVKFRNLKTPLGKMKSELFVPRFISTEELELILQANMSQFGKLERIPNGLKVTDWTLSVIELRELQKLVDLPPAENRLEAFVFQHELNGASKSPLDLVTVAENRGLVLQRLAIPELEADKDKNSLFSKKEPVLPIQAYSISYRANAFMIAVKDQLGVEAANIPGERTAGIELNQPMSFSFELDVAGEKVPYSASLRFFENPKAGEEGESPIWADLTCAPSGKMDERSKPRLVKCTLPILDGNNALIFQLDLGEFANHDPELKKNPIYAWRGNRIQKEVVIAFCPYKEARKRTQTTLSNAAIQATIHKQEVLGRKFYGSLNHSERENSARYFTLAQRLREALY